MNSKKDKDNPVPSIDESTVVVYTVEELLNEMSKDNDRIGDFEPLQWLISQSGLNLRMASGKIIFLSQNGVETDKEEPKCNICKDKIHINRICSCPDSEH